MYDMMRRRNAEPTRNRKRKVKCDERRPVCQKCTSNGRKCDGYESPFRFYTNQTSADASTTASRPNNSLSLIRPSLCEVNPQDIERLNHCFSIKTMLNVKMGCSDEARELLQASLTDPAIRHAVLSLRSLREDLDASGNGLTLVTQEVASYDYGLEQYNRALRGLVSSMPPVSSCRQRPRSVLLCCQIFISIEQLLGNYDAMAKHIIQGLAVMREYQARPRFIVPNTLVPSNPYPLPYLDLFIIKLFAAPCKFADHRTSNFISLSQEPNAESGNHRTIQHDVRTELTNIAESVLEFLEKLSSVKSAAAALRLQLEKAILLQMLKSWLTSWELVQPQNGSESLEPVSLHFLRMFYHIIQIVLLGSLDISRESHVQLQRENNQLQAVASIIGERIRHYRMYRVTK